ncbi:MAG: ATP-binding protein [Gemmataceae bacterium]|nr:ATP-binding protein [Gemmataceae bacterium]MCI0738043.1 ATP-binding protein [Gemmataceae bacterium]
MPKAKAVNPFKPGAGHVPPHLAGRDAEKEAFQKLLHQHEIIQNVVLTGLRGVGKTVLMEGVYKPLAINEGWIWIGSDFSEAAFVDEKAVCQRLFTDLSLFTSTLTVSSSEPSLGFRTTRLQKWPLEYPFLMEFCDSQAGLQSDKLKATLEFVWKQLEKTGKKGVLFAYDEAQVVQDRKDKDQYPLAMLLETFQSIQRKGMRYMLLLSGLPTLFPKLVESRTYAERMFKVQEIGKLQLAACKDAISKPLAGNPIQFSNESVEAIVKVSSSYPYFIQFICREAYDFFKSHYDLEQAPRAIPMDTLIRKLDADFFAGRWSKVPDRQRELLFCIACLENEEEEFSVNQVVDIAQKVAKKHDLKPFKAGDVNAMLPKLIDAGLLYKVRHGKYLLAVPLFGAFIRRQFESPKKQQPSLFDFLKER